MASELFRRMIMFSPEILDDLMENRSVSTDTLGSITHSVGTAQMSPNPFVTNRDQSLQQQSQQAGFVNRNMFGQGVAGPGVRRHLAAFERIVEASKKQNKPNNERIFTSYK